MRAVGFKLLIVIVSCGIGCACSSSSSSKSIRPSTTTAALSGEDQQWVAAAREGLLTDPDKPPEVTPAYGACLAEALITVVTVSRLRAAGMSVRDLQEGFGAESTDVPDELYDSLADETRQAFAAAVQKCGFGPVMAADFVRNIQDAGPSEGNAPQRKCLADALGSSQHRGLVASMRLRALPLPREASELSQILIECIDWAAMMQAELQLKLSSAERACINRTARNEPVLRKKLAAQINGNDYAGQDFREGLERACLTPKHAQIARRFEASQG